MDQVASGAEPEPAPPPARRGPRRGAVYVGLFGVALVLGGAWFWRGNATRSSGAGPAASGAAGPRPVPVVIAQVQVKDVPIYLEGIGNAVPLASVTVKTQVDGRLEKIFFTEGQSVKRGELLAQIDPRPFQIALQQAEAAIAKDAASAENARKNLERYESLVNQKLIAQQQADDQKALAASASAAVEADRALAASARLQLDYAKIKSPIDGVTGVRLVDPGNLLRATDATGIVVVTQLDPMAVVFTLPEDELPHVSKALALGPVAVEAYSRDARSLLGRGQLLLVDNQVNQQTATIKLKATFPNPERALWPNGFVKARLLLTTRKDAVVMPATAVQRGPQGTFVYLVDASNKVSVRPVTLDATEGELAVVRSGLVASDRVVVEGQSGLRPGAKVAPREAVSGAKP